MEPKNSLEEENRSIREAFGTLTRFYGALTSLNALARERTSEEGFLTRTISILIERAGFTAAGFYFADGPFLRLGIHHITDPDQHRDRHPLLFSLDPESPDSRAGTVRAFRTGIPVFIDDLQKTYHEAGLDRRAEDYRSIAFRSTGLCPFVRGGEIVGIFAVVSDRTHYFTPEIRELLLEASRIISFTLDYIDAECARRQSEEDFRTLVDALPDGVWLKDGKGAWILANQAALNLCGWSGRTDWA